MNYSDLLADAPAEYLRLLALENGIRRDLRGDRLREAVIKHMSDPRYLAQTIDSLDKPSREILKLFVLTSAPNGLPTGLVYRTLGRFVGVWQTDPLPLLQRLVRCGLVARVTTEQDYLCYMLPGEARQLLYAEVRQDLQGVLTAPEHTPASYREDGAAFLVDLHSLLEVVRLDPLRLTKTRRVYKRDRDRLQQMFDVKEQGDLPGKQPLERHDWLIQFSRYLQLLEEEENYMVLSPEPKEWISQPLHKQQEDLYAYWLAAQGYYVFQLPINVLKMLEPSRWFRIDSLVALLHRFGVEPISEELENTFLRTFISGAIWFGLLRYAQAEEACCLTEIGHRLFQGQPMEPAGDLEYTFVVQPNYEVLAEQRLAPEIRWQLAQIARLQRLDQMMLYKISQESVYRGLKSGIDSGQMIDFLQRYSRTGIPQNVEYAITEWASRYGHLEFVDAMILSCADAQLAAEIKATRKFQPHILGELSPIHLIVSRAGQRHLAAALEAAGYMPKPEITEASRN